MTQGSEAETLREEGFGTRHLFQSGPKWKTPAKAGAFHSIVSAQFFTNRTTFVALPCCTRSR